MSAQYQCLFSIEPLANNKANIVVTEYENCLYAGETYPAVDIPQSELRYQFQGVEYYFVTEFAWNQYFDKFS